MRRERSAVCPRDRRTWDRVRPTRAVVRRRPPPVARACSRLQGARGDIRPGASSSPARLRRPRRETPRTHRVLPRGRGCAPPTGRGSAGGRSARARTTLRSRRSRRSSRRPRRAPPAVHRAATAHFRSRVPTCARRCRQGSPLSPAARLPPVSLLRPSDSPLGPAPPVDRRLQYVDVLGLRLLLTQTVVLGVQPPLEHHVRRHQALEPGLRRPCEPIDGDADSE